MNKIQLTAAAEINRWHDLAEKHAGQAVEHARRAGALLMQVKAELKHGEFIPWMEKNIRVTPRQAQRYIAAAKPVPIRAIKNDKASHLEVDAPRLFAGEPPAPQFVPEPGMCHAHVADDETVYLVEPSSLHPGFFFVSRLNNDSESYDYTRRPIGAEWVEDSLQYYGLGDPAAANWRVKKTAGVLTAMETFDGVPA